LEGKRKTSNIDEAVELMSCREGKRRTEGMDEAPAEAPDKVLWEEGKFGTKSWEAGELVSW